MANRISTIFDFSQSDGLKKLKKDVAEADGAVGKLKASWSSASGMMKVAAAGMAASAGAAIVGFATKSIKAFQDTALAADKFANSTGMSVDSASRWLGVMSKWGVEIGDLQDVFNNVASKIEASDPIFEKLGITIATAADGTTDLDGTMKNIVQTLAAVEDPAKRAAAAASFFGEEGARQFGELVAQGKNVEEIFATLSSAQVIDDTEVAKAKALQSEMRELNEKMQSVAMTVGENLVPALVTAIEGVEKVGAALDALGLDELFDALDGNAEGADAAVSSLVKSFESGEASAADMANAFGGLVQAEIDATGGAEALGQVLGSDSLFGGKESEVDAMTDAFSKLAKRSPQAAGAVANAMIAVVKAAEGGNKTAQQWVEKWGLSTEVTDGFVDILREEAIAADASTSALGGATTATDELGGAATDAAPTVQEMADKVEDARDAAGKLATQIPLTNAELRNMREDADAAWKGIRDLQDQFDLLSASLSDSEAALDLEDSFAQAQSAMEDAFIAEQEGSEDAEAAINDHEQTLNSLKQEVIDYARKVGTIPPETVTEILAMIDEDKLAEAERRIALLTAERLVSIIPVMGRLPAGASPMGNGPVARNPTGSNAPFIPEGAGATGAIINRPTVGLMGEAGREALIPLDQTSGNSPLPALLGGGGVTNHYWTVNAGVNADGPEIARIIANKLREYQRFNGPGR